MPEIWLRYGNTHVVLELKMENFAGQISSKFQCAPADQIQAVVDGAALADETLILAMTGSKATAEVVSLLIESARKRGISNVTLDAPAAVASSLRSALDDPKYKEKISVNRLDHGSPILERIKKFKTSIFVSHTGIDPLFGFSGSQTLLLRHFLAKEMAEAFSAVRNTGPRPAQETEALRIAVDTPTGGAAAIEILADSNGIASIHLGEPKDAMDQAMQKLRSISTVEVDESNSMVISPSSDSFGHVTLSSAMNSLWNCAGSGVLREGGRAILVSECREGVGSLAVQRFVEGRLGEQDLGKIDYIEGLEHLVYLNQLKQKYQLALVSALPNYYASGKLGFATFSGMREVANMLTAKQRSARSLVISDPDVTILSPRPAG